MQLMIIVQIVILLVSEINFSTSSNNAVYCMDIALIEIKLIAYYIRTKCTYVIK